MDCFFKQPDNSKFKMAAYVFLPKLPEELALCVAKYDCTKLEHKKKMTKCFDGIHNVAKYKLLAGLPNEEQIHFNWGLTIWEVTDIVMSFTFLYPKGGINLSVHLPNLPDSIYLTIVKEDREETEDCYEYFEALLHMIGGFKNLDNFLLKMNMEFRDVVHRVRFVKKGIKNDDDINEALHNWKELVKSAPGDAMIN